ncbi:MAG: Rieske 2Fe-2S domain-containing protein [Rhodoferax sp.]|jgi:nitrite reductase/ring-hydroxylating ferredoxin subunit|nr:Rieske 2Fe-2S domain-containing protein [Rhodoferax sp.]MBP9058936.1 Rieske 2Fe-2S domain-containing protein [Rhodoferax sp.]MBP9683536.1 Rieske 2Fe-2S domain-containing protein [Rhodoferax sp.]
MNEKFTLCWNDLPGAPENGCLLARLDDIVDGGARLLSLGSGAASFGVILLRSGDSVLAYVNRCAHFGVPLASKVEHLYLKPHESLTCSVHYARYRWQDGACIKGDCEGEFLLKIPVTVIDGNIVIACKSN